MTQGSTLSFLLNPSLDIILRVILNEVQLTLDQVLGFADDLLFLCYSIQEFDKTILSFKNTLSERSYSDMIFSRNVCNLFSSVKRTDQTPVRDFLKVGSKCEEKNLNF